MLWPNSFFFFFFMLQWKIDHPFTVSAELNSKDMALGLTQGDYNGRDTVDCIQSEQL